MGAHRLIVVALGASLTLTACASVRDSRLNPFNWFGASRAAPAPAGEVNTLIPRRSALAKREAPAYSGRPIHSVTGLWIERVPGGAVIRAQGVARRQGAYSARLVRDDSRSVKGQLSYQLQTLLPPHATPTGTPASRTLDTAVHLTDQQLAGVHRVEITSATNARTARR